MAEAASRAHEREASAARELGGHEPSAQSVVMASEEGTSVL